MRFEEAAGALGQLGTKVNELTGKKPFIVAHSFGGIVGHLALRDGGIVFNGAEWKAIASRSLFGGLLTLGSPLSGIHKYATAIAGNTLTYGRDSDDSSIHACGSSTCYMAGASDGWTKTS